MYLVDTSVWIDFLRNKHTGVVDRFHRILASQIPFGITSLIFQEILQGASSSEDFAMLDQNLSTQNFFHPKHGLETYQKAALLYFDCRQKGITIRSSIDCLIAQIAIEHDVVLLHSDNDFLQIQTARPTLRLESGD